MRPNKTLNLVWIQTVCTLMEETTRSYLHCLLMPNKKDSQLFDFAYYSSVVCSQSLLFLVALCPKSTAMVIVVRLVQLITLFPGQA